MGEEKMLQLVEMRFKGLKKIRRVFNYKTIDYENLGGYELFEENGKYDAPLLEKESKTVNRLLRKILHEDKTFRLSDKKIKKFGFASLKHLVENKLEGQLHSGKLTQALIKYLQKKGVEFIFGVEAKRFEKVGNKMEVETNQGFTISSDLLIICTNAFTEHLLPHLKVDPARGQVLVTSPIPDLKIEGAFHYDEGFYYFRNLENRILLGGARNKFFDEERTVQFETSQNIQSELERFLHDVVLPEKSDYTIDYRWSGIMGMAKEKTPEIGQLDENVFYAVAMGGIGVATSPIVGERIMQMVLKKKRSTD
jgi:glycine/D-amino acid oxidase-like deaminating enzyme